MNLIDVHCHLDGDCYGDIPQLMQKISEAGVKKIIAVGCDLPTSRQAAETAEKYDMCYFTVGFHPTELSGFSEEALGEISELAKNPKCVAIGEIGLDFHYPETDVTKQIWAFLRQLKLADELGLPVQIHSRDSAEALLGLLQANKNLLKNGALLHCYSHSAEVALELEKLGVYFSFGGSSTWKDSKKVKKAIAALSEDRLLTETDSPYLAPESKHGTFPNTPESIPEILKNMAEIRNVTAEQMADAVWRNAHTLFKKL